MNPVFPSVEQLRPASEEALTKYVEKLYNDIDDLEDKINQKKTLLLQYLVEHYQSLTDEEIRDTLIQVKGVVLDC